MEANGLLSINAKKEIISFLNTVYIMKYFSGIIFTLSMLNEAYFFTVCNVGENMFQPLS